MPSLKRPPGTCPTRFNPRGARKRCRTAHRNSPGRPPSKRRRASPLSNTTGHPVPTPKFGQERASRPRNQYHSLRFSATGESCRQRARALALSPSPAGSAPGPASVPQRAFQYVCEKIPPLKLPHAPPPRPASSCGGNPHARHPNGAPLPSCPNSSARHIEKILSS